MLTTFYPVIGLAVQAGIGVSEGMASKAGINTMKSLDKMGVIKDEYAQQWKNATVGINVLGSSIDYMNEIEKLNQKGDGISMQQKLEWFGAVSSFEAGGLTGTVNQGLYNPKAILELKKWERSGIDSILEKEILRDYNRAKVIADIEANLIAEGKYTEEAKILLKGGEEEWEGCILNMNTEDFSDSVRKIQSAYHKIIKDDKLKYCGDHLKLQTIFQK